MQMYSCIVVCLCLFIQYVILCSYVARNFTTAMVYFASFHLFSMWTQVPPFELLQHGHSESVIASDTAPFVGESANENLFETPGPGTKSHAVEKTSTKHAEILGCGPKTLVMTYEVWLKRGPFRVT